MIDVIKLFANVFFIIIASSMLMFLISDEAAASIKRIVRRK